jgi:hypothetical protein
MRDLFDPPPTRPPEPPPPPGGSDFPFGIPPDVCALFEKLALELINDGWVHYSSDAILHRIRWHFQVERGVRDFKCNDHWTAPLARWFLSCHPQYPEFFELRMRRSQDEENSDD